MPARIAVLKETAAGERRVAATTETVRKLLAMGAGDGVAISDAADREAGAAIGDREAMVAGADIVLAVQGPNPIALTGASRGAWLAGVLDPFAERARVAGYAAAGVEAIAMEWMPRITRARAMDILSSQSNLAEGL